MTDTKINDRRFYKAQQEADFAEQQLSTPQTQSKSYRLAFQDTEFLLREDLRPVRFQLELLKIIFQIRILTFRKLHLVRCLLRCLHM
jgi:hypothetical protein